MRRATLFCPASLAVVIFASIATPAEPNFWAVEHSVIVDGMRRRYLIFAPKRFDKPLLVVLALHGGGSNARQMERYTRFNDLAAKEGFSWLSIPRQWMGTGTTVGASRASGLSRRTSTT
jgi:poly(3-hydroxybutyrate) depolymerase